MIRLNAEYSVLYAEYQKRHSDPRNQLCHLFGVPMIAAAHTPEKAGRNHSRAELPA
jgi:hypothetical protein